MVRKCLVLLIPIILSLALFVPPVSAQDKPVQLALVAPLQIFDENTAIRGVRLNLIYGRNISVTGLDWGLVNHTTSGVSKGVQWGCLSLMESDFVGWQNSWVNVTRGDFEGFQWGMFNYANHGNGFQLALVNYAVTLNGLQVGLVNIIRQGGQFPVFPIVNWSFK